jgi:nicotinamide-nucleotide amidase
MFPAHIARLAETVLAEARAKKLKLVTAESCTGGLVAAVLTEIAGSSDVFERGFVTYANEAKVQNLGVPEQMLSEHGAVSMATAQAMAEGALRHSQADVSVAITGIAGPTGGSRDKPVGLVHLAAARKGQPTHLQERRFGNVGRNKIRMDSVEVALNLLRRQIAGA